MNRCPVFQTAAEICRTFFGRFQVVPQSSPCALHLGFTHLVRFVSYDPRYPFEVLDRGSPFRSEAEADQYCKTQLEYAIERISEFREEERERLAAAMLHESASGYQAHPTYDALLLKYLPELLSALSRRAVLTKKGGKISLPPAPCLTDIEGIAAKLSEAPPKVLKKSTSYF